MDDKVSQQGAEEQQEIGWIKAFLANEPGAFDQLVLRHQDRVFNLCYRLLGDYEEAGDCAQEVFVKVFRSLQQFKFHARFSTWVYAIAVNTCKNRLKSPQYRVWKKMLRLDPPAAAQDAAGILEIADPAPSPLAQLVTREQDQRLQKAIDRLPQEAKAIVILRDVEGLSYEEIAEITGYHLGTVKSKLARARRQLREWLQEI
jgi:RNA polymerase sigma-70 factor (ECF subfamily)